MQFRFTYNPLTSIKDIGFYRARKNEGLLRNISDFIGEFFS